MSEALGKIKPTAEMKTAQKDVLNLSLDANFALPGDPGWPLNQVSASCAYCLLIFFPLLFSHVLLEENTIK